MIRRKGIIVGILGIVLAAVLPYMAKAEIQTGGNNFAAQVQEETVELPEGLEPDMEDPDYVKRFIVQPQADETSVMSLRSVSASKTRSPFTGQTYTHAAYLSDYEIVHGIDVSKWQAEIDWNKVKNAGVKYVFIRCGYTSLGSTFAMYEDNYFKQNIQNAYNAGIRVGVYFFSNSLNVSEAKKEANKTLNLIAPYKNLITMPVVYDFEAFNATYRAYGLTMKQVTDNALAYMEIIRDAGYTPMYYGSPNFLESHFDTDRLGSYDCWLANYTTKSSYEGDYSYWQYSSTGTVDGISGSVDCNFQYAGKSSSYVGGDVGGPDQVTGLTMYKNSSTAIRISWNPVEGASGYKIYRSDVYGGTYELVETINNASAVNWRDGDFPVTAGKQYYYKVAAFTIEGNELLYGRESSILTAYLNQIYKYRLSTTTSLNLRTQAGTEYDKVAALPAGTVLNYTKYTYSTDRKKWYKVNYKVNGKSYIGYLSGSYVNLYTYGQTKQQLPLRTGTALTASKVLTLSSGEQVTIRSTTKDSSGRSWNYVQYKKDGKTYKGYVLTKNLKRI